MEYIQKLFFKGCKFWFSVCTYLLLLCRCSSLYNSSHFELV